MAIKRKRDNEVGKLLVDALTEVVKEREEKKEKAQELLKKQEVCDSGKLCHCGGKIINIKSWAIRVFASDIIGGNCYRELRPEDLIENHTPYHCQNCGIQYFKLPQDDK